MGQSGSTERTVGDRGMRGEERVDPLSQRSSDPWGKKMCALLSFTVRVYLLSRPSSGTRD